MKHKVAALLVAGSLACGTVAGFALASGAAAQGSTVRYRVITKTFAVNPGFSKVVDVKCPSGLVPVGGGAHVGNGSFIAGWPTEAGVLASDIDLSHRGWGAGVFVTGTTGPTSFTANVVCAAL